jgi:Glutaredoxin-like domain (DUF836)
VSAIATVTMYSRRRCHLCDDARAVLLAQLASTPFTFDERFIDGDDDLEKSYGLRVPVVEIDGVEEFEYLVDATALRSLLRR